MKLVKVKLQNFRGYSQPIEVKVDNLTALIGKNDIGKSTIIEALNTFFNETKLDVQDRYIHAHNDDATVICCIFDDLPQSIILDETVQTSLSEEYLLNAEGKLEVVKKCNNIGKQSVFVNAVHPNNTGFEELLAKKNSELKKMIRE